MRKGLFFIFSIISFASFSQGKSIGDIEADFQGGKSEFKQLLLHEMIYPKEKLEKEIKAKVGYEVFVKANGDAMITRPLFTSTEDFNKEAKRLIQLTEFVPGAIDGDPYDSKKFVVIKFKPSKYQHMQQERGYQEPTYPDNNSKSYEVFNTEMVDVSPRPILPKPYYSLDDFIYKNVVYPQHAIKMNMTGKTILEFVVEPSGNITNVHPLHYLGGGCYEEARKVLGKLKWSPAEKNGEVVRCKMQHTVYFTLPSKAGRSALETITE